MGMGGIRGGKGSLENKLQNLWGGGRKVREIHRLGNAGFFYLKWGNVLSLCSFRKAEATGRKTETSHRSIGGRRRGRKGGDLWGSLL